MIVSKEKRQSNITEYILYLWQVEDLIRALDLDIEKINTTLIPSYNADGSTSLEISHWYENLVLMMQKEQKQKTGHLQFLVNLTDDLNRFHLAIIKEQVDHEYIKLYQDIKSDIELVRQKSKRDDTDVEVALNTLYLILMLKMNKKEISEGTQQAVFKFGNFMGHLSKLFKAYESGDLELNY
ncbi:MAG: DUF4924 family protein [Prolixibacteraceae bacterium]